VTLLETAESAAARVSRGIAAFRAITRTICAAGKDTFVLRADARTRPSSCQGLLRSAAAYNQFVTGER